MRPYIVSTRCSHALPLCARLQQAISIVMLSIVIVLLGTSAEAADQKTKIQTCAVMTELQAVDRDKGADVRVIDEYQDVVARLFTREEFDQLDCLADSARSFKARFAGGMWKLHNFYTALDSPRLHPTPADWNQHMHHLSRWVARKPNSMTARVALAEALLAYAWEARGDGTADTVSNDGWRLFEQRTEEAKTVLLSAKVLPMCPEWYVAMQRVALAQGWKRERAATLLQQAVAFEPGYFYFYRMFANYLLPQWFGEEGDSERFAKDAADRLGGARGDILYAQIASCMCDPEERFKNMSWPRIQRGFAAMEGQYGQSVINRNAFAYMAVKKNDAIVADRELSSIGDRWDKDVWHNKSYYDSCKTWAADTQKWAKARASMDTERISMEKAAAANLKTPEGQSYYKRFDAELAKVASQCAKTPGADLRKFEMIFKVGERGMFAQTFTYSSTVVTACVMSHFGEDLYPAPPHGDYLVRFDVDPAKYVDTPDKQAIGR